MEGYIKNTTKNIPTNIDNHIIKLLKLIFISLLNINPPNYNNA